MKRREWHSKGKAVPGTELISKAKEKQGKAPNRQAKQKR